MKASGDDERAMSDREKAAEAPKTPDTPPADRPVTRVRLIARPRRAGFDVNASIRRAMARYPTVRAYLARTD